jgi:hypothetical protein
MDNNGIVDENLLLDLVGNEDDVDTDMYTIISKWDNDEYAAMKEREIKESRTTAKENIKTGFENSILTFTCSCGIEMDATVEDMRLLKDGIEYLESQGVTNISVTDYKNKEHSKTMAEAKEMLEELQGNFFVQRKKKIDLRNQINDAATIEELESIVW